MVGRLITFEGVDGCGKTTQIKKIYDYLAANNFKVKMVREPGETAIGVEIREYLKDPSNRPMDSWVELILIEADRALLYHEIILPYLDDGYVILSDRGPMGSIAYQGYGRGLERNMIMEISKNVTQHCVPDLAIVYQLNIKEVTRRLKERGVSEDDPFESDLGFLERVNDGFRNIATNSEYAHLLLADKSIEDVYSVTLELVQSLLDIKKVVVT